MIGFEQIGTKLIGSGLKLCFRTLNGGLNGGHSTAHPTTAGDGMKGPAVPWSLLKGNVRVIQA